MDKKTRWVSDGKYYTSSGVSAVIDMTLGFVKDMMGIDVAGKIAAGIEYIWNKNKAVIHFVEQTEPADGVR